jgi:hypothetical protein
VQEDAFDDAKVCNLMVLQKNRRKPFATSNYASWQHHGRYEAKRGTMKRQHHLCAQEWEQIFEIVGGILKLHREEKKDC